MSHMKWLRLAITPIVAFSAMMFAGAASASAPTPPFTQCPPVGADTSCGTLIVVNSGGSLESFNDPTQGPFDSVEDTMIGVQNNSSSPVSSIALEGGFIFGFDGDGICSGFYSPAPPACPYGPTGYEGPGTEFSFTSASEGSVKFVPSGLAPGASTYFSLEGPVTLTCSGSTCGVGTPEPKPTQLSTSLSGGGQSGGSITAQEGTGVTDSATLSGENAAKATGTVTYNVYSDKECKNLVASAGEVEVAGGVVPASNPEKLALGPYYWQASYKGDANNEPSTSECGTEKLLVYGTAKGGNFVIGDKNAATGTAVTFWGAQWWKLNSLSGGSGPAAFKGFEDNPATAVCGKSWTSRPGNSTPPPAGPLPSYMAVIVSSKVSQSGSSISGNTVHLVVVKTNPGYESNPGHAGTGTVVATIC